MALAAVRELASALVPGRTLETTGDLARFVTKLHDMAEMFCRCFIPLREGYSQFVSSMDLQRAKRQRSIYASRSLLAVEGAKDSASLAAALLDYRDDSFDAHKGVEGIFADLMIHQMAMLNGVLLGVRALLDELAPENLEKSTGETGVFGLDVSGARTKALWKAYCERYAELADEEQAFSRIFGPEFTEAYRSYRKQTDKG
jgi:type VI secretion system protein ImpI